MLRNFFSLGWQGIIGSWDFVPIKLTPILTEIEIRIGLKTKSLAKNGNQMSLYVLIRVKTKDIGLEVVSGSKKIAICVGLLACAGRRSWINFQINMKGAIMDNLLIKYNDALFKVNTFAGLKCYQKVKEVLAEFDVKLSQEMSGISKDSQNNRDNNLKVDKLV